MHVAVPVLIASGVILVAVRLLVIYKGKIDFYSKGTDMGFRAGELRALWRLAKECDLDEPQALFVSVNALNSCIATVISQAQKDGTEQSENVQAFLSRLYDYRTRITLESDRRKGIESTKYLAERQKVSVVLKGQGVFSARILSAGRDLILSLPTRFNPKTESLFFLKPKDWEGKSVSVYLWRKGDAGYAFDTQVTASGTYRAQPALFLRHTDKLDRSQKRQSIRAVCEIYAQMYMITGPDVDYERVEEEPGFRCFLEDISEDGAMIRIGGKGRSNVQIKLQFTLGGTLIIMHGVIRAVEFNAALDQSRLHFECTHISPGMRNAVLTYVYNVMPPEEQEIHDALMRLEEDDGADAEENHSAEENPRPPLENAGNSDTITIGEYKPADDGEPDRTGPAQE